MIYINVAKQSNYPISSVKIKKFLQNFFKNHGIVSDAECNVSFVGEEKMKALGKKYYKDNNLHNVFSFVESELLDFKNVTDVIQLGEIVVCFPVVLKEAKMEGKLIEEKALELIGHSALHLLGIHHN
ncbi:MAG: rRNA maturation RNase YbeY [Candidatus Woesebacteria bacterium]|nr:rRNA maturation RNase YbeY [Candidatus Woesebacteria bacterium]